MQSLLAYDLDTPKLSSLPAEFTTAVHELWLDAAFKREVCEYAGDSVVMDSAT